MNSYTAARSSGDKLATNVERSCAGILPSSPSIITTQTLLFRLLPAYKFLTNCSGLFHRQVRYSLAPSREGRLPTRVKHVDYGFFRGLHPQHRFHDLFLLQTGLRGEAPREAATPAAGILRRFFHLSSSSQKKRATRTKNIVSMPPRPKLSGATAGVEQRNAATPPGDSAELLAHRRIVSLFAQGPGRKAS